MMELLIKPPQKSPCCSAPGLKVHLFHITDLANRCIMPLGILRMGSGVTPTSTLPKSKQKRTALTGHSVKTIWDIFDEGVSFMTEWIIGNKPAYAGLYWVTVGLNGNNKLYNEPMNYENGTWKHNGREYCGNIVAYMECNKPKEAYNELHIGFPDQYYLRVKCNGMTRYLSKGLQSVKWSKTGYSTKEKAKAASKRLRKIEPEYGYAGQKTEIVVVNGNGEEI